LRSGRAHVAIARNSFWTAASLADIIRRFKNLGKSMIQFPECKYSILSCFSL
jgi:hypothetical protein